MANTLSITTHGWIELRRVLCVLVIACLTGILIQSPSPMVVSASSGYELLYSGLNFPVEFTFAHDGRIFFNEKNTGNIRVIGSNGIILQQPFTTVGPLPPGVDGTEQGLLGIALDPHFDTNHYLYAYWTYWDGTYKHSRITRFTDSANIGVSATIIFDFTDPNPTQPPSGPTNHNGGYIKFGPDGKLYVEIGDFCSWDCLGNPLAQNRSTYAGKILRMNSDGSVPSDNPFSDSLIYSYGYRNGVGMDFSSTGKLIATMAGPDCCDRILSVSAGENFGWPNCGTDSQPTCSSPYTSSIYQWGQPTVTPTGIAYSLDDNVLYFGEDNTGNLMQLILNPDGSAAAVNLIFASFSGGIIAVERAPDGSIWFSTPTAIYRYNPPAHPPTGIYSVVRGSDNAIYFGSIGWIKLLAGATSDGPGAVQCGGQLYLAVRGMDNGVWFGSINTATSAFSGWTQLPGGTLSAPGLAADSSCNLFLAVRGMDNGVYLNTHVGGSWQGWSRLPGATTNGPSVAVTASTIYLAVRGTDNGIYFGGITRNGMIFNGWTSVGGATYGRPGLAAVSDSDVYMAVGGTDNGIYLNKWNGANWAGWVAPAGGATPSGPGLIVHGGALYLMVQGTDNGIYWSSGTWGGSWSAWTKLSGATPSSPTLA